MADLYDIGHASQGYIADQSLLLQDIRDGLEIYNSEGSAETLMQQWCEETIRETTRVSQAPFRFRKAAEGAGSENQRSSFRMLYTPFEDFDLSTQYTLQGLQDMLPSDVEADMKASMIGDNELILKLMYQVMLVPHASPSTVGTKMSVRNGFYNGETDVPRWRTNAFGSAHSHYAGLNTVTLALSHISGMAKDIQEHGFGMTPGSLVLRINAQEGKAVTDLAGFTQGGVDSPERRALAARGVTGFMGTLAGASIVQDDWVPAGYLLMRDESVKHLQRRKHPNAAVNGLQIYAPHEATDHPLVGAQFLRRTGFGVSLMAAGTVRQLVASTSYTAPTSYDFS